SIPTFPFLFFPPQHPYSSQTLGRSALITTSQSQPHSPLITMPHTHKYSMRASNLPTWSPITPPLRRRAQPPKYEHPWSLDVEFGDDLVIEELDLGAPAIPLWWATDDEHTHYVLRRKGGQKVVFSEGEWEVGGREWDTERLREGGCRGWRGRWLGRRGWEGGGGVMGSLFEFG
ncbi:hypothetical protein V8E51_017805, partial [Hyaloscypha variabilis]